MNLFSLYGFLAVAAIATVGFILFEFSAWSGRFRWRWLFASGVVPLLVLAPFIHDVNLEAGVAPALGAACGFLLGWYVTLPFFYWFSTHEAKGSTEHEQPS